VGFRRESLRYRKRKDKNRSEQATRNTEIQKNNKTPKQEHARPLKKATQEQGEKVRVLDKYYKEAENRI
jgi:hypothetical protein